MKVCQRSKNLRAVQFDRNEINMIFNFEHVDIDHGKYDKFEPGTLKEVLQISEFPATRFKLVIFAMINVYMFEVEDANDGWNALYWENHDQPRSVDRYTNASEEYRLVACITFSSDSNNQCLCILQYPMIWAHF
jgi:glycosidase